MITITANMITDNLTDNLFDLNIDLPYGTDMERFREYFADTIVDLYIDYGIIDSYEFAGTLSMEDLYDAMNTDIDDLMSTNDAYDFSECFPNVTTLEDARNALEASIDDDIRSMIANAIRETLEKATGLDICSSTSDGMIVLP